MFEGPCFLHDATYVFFFFSFVQYATDVLVCVTRNCIWLQTRHSVRFLQNLVLIVFNTSVWRALTLSRTAFLFVSGGRIYPESRTAFQYRCCWYGT